MPHRAIRFVLCALLVLTCATRVVGGSVPEAQDAPPSNAAELYRQAMAWWERAAHGEGDEQVGRIFSDDELQALSESVEGNPSPTMLAAREKAKHFIDMIRQAGRTDSCDFQLDRSQGWELLLPHLGGMHNMTRVLRLDAELRLRDGDSNGALENLEAIAGFARHSRGDELLISSLVSGAILSLQDRVLHEAMYEGDFDQAAAERMARALAAFSDGDPMGMHAAILGEGTMSRISIERALESGKGLADLFALAGENINDELLALPPEEVRAQAVRFESLCGEIAAAQANPDRDAARAALAEIEERVAAGDEGILAKLLLPSTTRLVERNWRFADALAATLDELKDIREGRVSLERSTNAAFAYLRAAALMDGMPEEMQAVVETARLAATALDEEGNRTAQRVTAPFREPLRSAFDDAARCEHCDFRVSGGPKFFLIPRYLPGLRAAVRLALADSLVGAAGSLGADGRVRGSDVAPITVEEAVAAALRLARHLADDPRIGHAIYAGAIVEDASKALVDAQSRGLLGEGERERLRALAERIDRADPFALAAAVKAERERFAAPTGLALQLGDPREKWEALFARMSAPTLAWLMLSRQIVEETKPPATPPPGPETASREGESPPAERGPWSKEGLGAPLLGMGDFVPIETVRAFDAIELRTAAAIGLDDQWRRASQRLDSLRDIVRRRPSSGAPEPEARVRASLEKLVVLDELLAPNPRAARDGQPAVPATR